MGKKFDRCIKKVRKQSPKVNPYAVCKASLKKKLDNSNLIDKVFEKFKKSINMNLTELKIWRANPISKTASLDRKPINRVISLLSKKKSNWTLGDVKKANKVISYIARAKKIKRKKGFPKNQLTPNEIALRNWGYDKFKK